MRHALLALVLALSIAGCGKKKSPANPSNETQAAPTDDEKTDEEKNVNTPDDRDDAATSSDPCEGGE